MKLVFSTIRILALMLPVVASGQVSLNDAVNDAKSEGTVLSARTVDGQHEIKVLTPSGTVKTINRSAQSGRESKRPEYYLRGGQSMRDRNQNPVIPDRFNNNSQNSRTRHAFNRSNQRNSSNNQLQNKRNDSKPKRNNNSKSKKDK
jgi:hypothetical protein